MTTTMLKALLALVLIAGTIAITGCLDPHDTHVRSPLPAPR